MQQITPSRMLSVGEAADFLRISKSWLNKRRCLGGPDVQGEQGSGKSGTSRLLRALLDPNCVPIRALPHSERDLMIAATNGHVLAFDNVSTLPPWLSDTLCRLSTGGGLATRRNYTDREEELFKAVRPVILNGIEHFVTRQDLADRSIFITLEHIPDERRMPQEDLWAKFEDQLPRILGALLDAVVEGLGNLSDVQATGLPRMAGFAKRTPCALGSTSPRGTLSAQARH